MGQYRRRRLLLLVCLLAAAVVCWSCAGRIRAWFAGPFEASDLKVRRDFHYSNYRFAHTRAFGRSFGHNWEAFEDLPLHDKCLRFFSHMKAAQPDWRFNAATTSAYAKDVATKDKFALRMVRRFKTQADFGPDGKLLGSYSAADRALIDGWFAELVRDTRAVEQAMADDATVLRVFAHCFLAPDRDALLLLPDLAPLYRWFAPRVVPVFLGSFPLVEHKDGSVLLDSFSYDSPTYNPELGILHHYRHHMSGTGIVISANSRFTGPIVRLIRVLRAMGNTLPIQIVCRGDILLRAKSVLVAVAAQPKSELLDLLYSDTKLWQKLYPGFDANHDAVKHLEYPPQDLLFLNIDKSIHKSYKGALTNFNNKILALFFCTFEKAVLFDADAVPLVPPAELVNAPEFARAGAFFFQDRGIRDQNDWIETNLFAKLMPHAHNTLDMAMGIKPVSDHTMANPYMTGWRHYQEAGALVLDKRRHFGIFTTLFALPLWGDLIGSMIWGDKEMYWLAMSMAGDESYEMNKYAAASVGEITQSNHLKAYNNTDARELCSSHPGHVSLEGKLLWINSGFAYCKMNSVSRDLRHFPFSQFTDRAAAEDLFNRPLTLRHAIVPPSPPMFRLPGGDPESVREQELLRLFKGRKKDIDESDVDQIGTFGPQKGWVKSPLCSHYTYCAYDAIESYTEPGGLDKGHFFSFAPEDVEKYEFLGAMWLTGNRPTKARGFQGKGP